MDTPGPNVKFQMSAPGTYSVIFDKHIVGNKYIVVEWKVRVWCS